MCGICGFTGNITGWTSGENKEAAQQNRASDTVKVQVAGKAENAEGRSQVLTNMMNRIIHRGPDGGGQYIDSGIAMGFRRLSIIDLKGGDQPMATADGSRIISFNGEIYNYRELREDLKIKGHTFLTNSDTEVLLHGFTEYGPRILNRLRGMFAFVIWDARKKELFGARDMFGIKPFYYAQIDGNFVYGSEIKSILEYPGYDRQVNLQALEEYMSFQYSVLPETFFKGIFRLPDITWSGKTERSEPAGILILCLLPAPWMRRAMPAERKRTPRPAERKMLRPAERRERTPRTRGWSTKSTAQCGNLSSTTW